MTVDERRFSHWTGINIMKWYYIHALDGEYWQDSLNRHRYYECWNPLRYRHQLWMILRKIVNIHAPA